MHEREGGSEEDVRQALGVHERDVGNWGLSERGAHLFAVDVQVAAIGIPMLIVIRAVLTSKLVIFG